MKFTETIHCASRGHCVACRDAAGRGQRFRASLAKVYEMPGEGLFACPFGVTAASLPAPVQITIAAPAPLPRADWPLWAKTIALAATDADKGIGDTVARTIGEPASMAFKAWYLAIFGKTCGCERRRMEWNAKYPY